LAERNLTFAPNEEKLKPIFIDEKAFELLSSPSNKDSLKAFWDYRAILIAKDLVRRTRVVL